MSNELIQIQAGKTGTESNVSGSAAPTNQPCARAKTFYLETFGCQMNVHDSEKVSGALVAKGYRAVGSYEDADLILYNTCSIRENAAQKVFSRLGAFKKAYPGSSKIIGLLGCVAQQEGERVFDRAPQVSLVCGSASYGKIAELVERLEAGERRVAGLSLDTDECFETEITSRSNPYRAYITIIEGCDKACAYCVVPTTRGPERSRTSASVLEEARRLADQGYTEIQLLGQTVNSYRDPSPARMNFPQLLLAAAEIKGLRRVRFTTSHPKDFDEDIVRAIDSSPVLCDHVHLPVQCGSNRVLRAMKRTYTREEYLEKISCIRSAKRAISISTDIIVGFCGETRDDFEQTLSLLAEVEYDQVFSFKYSPRPNTSAGKLEDSVGDEEKRQRLQELQERQRQIQIRRNQALAGRDVEVLVEGFQPRLRQAVGRTSTNHVVNFSGDADWAGRYMSVRVVSAGPNSLVGVLAG
ncbi:MAG: tRNA (N6-isopentenyl adenosine(37)-C2)-methylthiotransferase MiaB [Terriglobia bacterium]